MGELTPLQLSALSKRHAQKEELLERRNASLIATILNSRMGIKKQQLVTVDDLLKAPAKTKTPQIMSVEEQQLNVAKLMQVFGGTDNRKKGGGSNG